MSRIPAVVSVEGGAPPPGLEEGTAPAETRGSWLTLQVAQLAGERPYPRAVGCAHVPPSHRRRGWSGEEDLAAEGRPGVIREVMVESRSPLIPSMLAGNAKRPPKANSPVTRGMMVESRSPLIPWWLVSCRSCVWCGMKPL
jgi:hypothetical protein